MTPCVKKEGITAKRKKKSFKFLKNPFFFSLNFYLSVSRFFGVLFFSVPKLDVTVLVAVFITDHKLTYCIVSNKVFKL